MKTERQIKKLAADVTIRLRAVVETLDGMDEETPVCAKVYAKFLRQALEWSRELEEALRAQRQSGDNDPEAA